MFLKRWSKYTAFTNDKSKVIVQFSDENMSKMTILDYILIRVFNRKDYLGVLLMNLEDIVENSKEFKEFFINFIGLLLPIWELLTNILWIICFPITFPLEAFVVIRKAKKTLKK